MGCGCNKTKFQEKILSKKEEVLPIPKILSDDALGQRLSRIKARKERIARREARIKARNLLKEKNPDIV